MQNKSLAGDSAHNRGKLGEALLGHLPCIIDVSDELR
eukprot:CAMPEP_0203915692 /NCGR_PEP_ID=MMETSP0359-20131031/56467_1 /ASSEMBLY_ACC=CAM_ASM_000338 /TAXON_ID=268821 /ORGANISM="Scrippsiella Hangoei, Strain SHTV-5" /LENGTH=36 /DNA_ID= /DNA_START= /DNA_END= /DNA_ORIENTATION=